MDTGWCRFVRAGDVLCVKQREPWSNISASSKALDPFVVRLLLQKAIDVSMGIRVNCGELIRPWAVMRKHGGGFGEPFLPLDRKSRLVRNGADAMKTNRKTCDLCASTWPGRAVLRITGQVHGGSRNRLLLVKVQGASGQRASS